MHTLETCAALRCPRNRPDTHTSALVVDLERTGQARAEINGATITVRKYPDGTYDARVERDWTHVTTGARREVDACIMRALELALSTDETGAPNLYGSYR
jgi:hypothetical protein